MRKMTISRKFRFHVSLRSDAFDLWGRIFGWLATLPPPPPTNGFVFRACESLSACRTQKPIQTFVSSIIVFFPWFQNPPLKYCQILARLVSLETNLFAEGNMWHILKGITFFSHWLVVEVGLAFNNFFFQTFIREIKTKFLFNICTCIRRKIQQRAIVTVQWETSL